MKYIVFEQSGIQTALLFDPLIWHTTFKHLKPISAGFFSLTEKNVAKKYAFGTLNASYVPEVHVFGRSTGLELKFRPEDAAIIERCLSHTST